jgi:TrmH family RNA methyltransferase
MSQITSLRNPRVQRAVHLRSARHRVRQRRYVIDGLRELRLALAANASIEEAFACRQLFHDAQGDQLLKRLADSGTDVWNVTPQVFEKLAFGQRAEGLVAIGITPDADLDRLVPRTTGPLGVLVGVEKPGNVGAVLRSADGAGAAAVIVVDGGTDLFNPNAIRASLGTIFNIPLAQGTSPQVLDWLRQQGRPIYAARPGAKILYTDAPLAQGAIVLGSEAQGLPPIWSAPDVTGVAIPMRGAADSLNVSAAAAVLFYEAWRQRCS